MKRFTQWLLQLKLDIGHVRSEIYQNKMSYERKKKELELQLKALQEKCPHITTHREPDPSGNNDSTTTCLDCDKYLSR